MVPPPGRGGLPSAVRNALGAARNGVGVRLVLQLRLLAHLQDGAQLLADVLERRDVVLGPGPHADARPLLPPRQHCAADLRLGPRRPDLWLGMDHVAVPIKQEEYTSKESTGVLSIKIGSTRPLYPACSGARDRLKAPKIGPLARGTGLHLSRTRTPCLGGWGMEYSSDSGECSCFKAIFLQTYASVNELKKTDPIPEPKPVRRFETITATI